MISRLVNLGKNLYLLDAAQIVDVTDQSVIAIEKNGCSRGETHALAPLRA
jgi:DNA-binding XRE family transcriptional regulator